MFMLTSIELWISVMHCAFNFLMLLDAGTGSGPNKQSKPPGSVTTAMPGGATAGMGSGTTAGMGSGTTVGSGMYDKCINYILFTFYIFLNCSCVI